MMPKKCIVYSFGGSGGEAPRKLHDFIDFEGFDNHFSSMSRRMSFYQSTFL
jgi:hypothetical protein